MTTAAEPVAAPARFANYPGDVTCMVGQLVGPNTFGEVLKCVVAAYNPATDTTRAGFAYWIDSRALAQAKT